MTVVCDSVKPGSAGSAGQSLLLLCDIGNTSLKFGIADAAGLKASFAFPSHADATADSLGLQLLAAVHHANPAGLPLQACVAVSVVPVLNPVLREAASCYLGCETLFASDGLSIPLENHYDRPAEVGADRLVGAWAARRAFPGDRDIIVVDFGTAVTFDCVSGNAYMGGLIFPGPATAAAALARHTARLPHVCLDVPDSEPAPCRDTATSIRHGLVFGYAALVEGLCAKLASRFSGGAKIVATGGFAPAIGRLTSVFDAIMPGLLLDGLAGLYYLENGSANNAR